MIRFIWFINSTVFLLVLLVGGFAFWLYPKQEISNDENRKLMTFPTLNSKTIFSGKFEKDFEEYYNDHFPMRDKWLELASAINALKGVQEQEIRVLSVAKTNDQEVLEEEAKSEEVAQLEMEHHIVESTNINSDDLSSIDNNQEVEKTLPIIVESNNREITEINKEENIEDEQNTDEQSSQKNEVNNDEFSKVKGLVIVNNRVLQVFAGTKHSINPYIKMMNSYRAKLPNDIKMYTMIVPSGSDFYLPNKVNKGVHKEKENIEYFNDTIVEDIIYVPTYDVLSRHKNEYIYFKTDHHWTGLGAYYAYTAFAKKAEFEPLALDKMTFKQKDKSFLGSLYNYTKDKQVKNNPDILEYYKVPVESDVTVYMDAKKNFKGDLYSERNNSYLLFIGGDYPLTHIHTSSSPLRKILIIKDSFGNAFVPYLASHYSDIYVIDYRYFKDNILDMMKEKEIKELLYIHNTFAANSSASTKFGLNLLNKRNKNVKKN